MSETLNFTFTSKELETVIETAVEKAVSKLGIKASVSSLTERSNGRAKFVKIKEFAQEFNVTSEAVRKWILQGKIEGIRLKGSDIWRIPIEEIEKYKRNSRKETNADIFNRSF
jgi:excisionase family DNA binding protein